MSWNYGNYASSSAPGSQQWANEHGLRYDFSEGRWVYADGTPYVPVGSVSTDSHDSQEPRGIDAALATGALQTSRARRASELGSSPRTSNYGISNEVDDDLAATFANTTLREDRTSTQQAVIHFGTIDRGPPELVTDPSLYDRGMLSRGRIRGTPGDRETLDPDFRIQRRPKDFFILGKIFRILWPEQPGPHTANVTVISGGYLNQDIIYKFRWFVVVKAGSNSCSCLPITTYQGRGVTKPKAQKWQHSMIYSGKTEPSLIRGEEPAEGEEGMMRSIRANSKKKGDKIHAASRIDYSRVYTVDHHVKVKEFGDVIEKDLKRLWKQWWLVFSKNDEVSTSSEDDVPTQEPSQSEGPEYLEWVTAKYAYNDADMMKMQAGDRIGVLAVVTDHWWKGLNLRTDEINLFPSNYVDRSPY